MPNTPEPVEIMNGDMFSYDDPESDELPETCPRLIRQDAVYLPFTVVYINQQE